MQPSFDDLMNGGAASQPTFDDLMPQPEPTAFDALMEGGTTKKAPVTQAFGNVNPGIEVMSVDGVNNGVDFGYKYGDEVKAPQGDWVVEESYSGDTGHGYIGNNSNSGYGNSVKLKNPQTGEVVRLSHLSTNFAKPGMTVRGGSLLGLVGDTGNTTGAHLDAEYLDAQGQYQDILKSPYGSTYGSNASAAGAGGGGNPLADAINNLGRGMGQQTILPLPNTPTYQQAAQAVSAITAPQGSTVQSPLSRFFSGQTEKIGRDTKARVIQQGQDMQTAEGIMGVAPIGNIATKAAKQVGTALPPIPQAFQGAANLTTNVLDRLKGRNAVSPQFIQDLTKMPDVKQAERDVIEKTLQKHTDAKIPVTQFAKDVEDELLPLERIQDFRKGGRYDNITLPNKVRGNVADYRENIYNSPIPTSAGNVHWDGHDNYFAHTRVEDLLDPELAQYVEGANLGNTPELAGSTRRVIELQSDLFQKGRLDSEVSTTDLDELTMARENLTPDEIERTYGSGWAKGVDDRKLEVDKLKPYENTWHERVIREEVKKAAQDGKSVLQFPTGETAMKIEGLGQQTNNWFLRGGSDGPTTLTPQDLKVGAELSNAGQGDGWVVTDVLGDGKFRAVPKRSLNQLIESPNPTSADYEEALREMQEDVNMDAFTEQFDISGKVDQNNPIYKFYESEVGKYLKKKYNAELMTDPQGVQWWQLQVDPETAKKPVSAFGLVAPAIGAAGAVGAVQQNREESNNY